MEGVLLQRFTPYENDDTKLYEDITRNINTALTMLFSIECLLKIFGFGLRVNMLALS